MCTITHENRVYRNLSHIVTLHVKILLSLITKKHKPKNTLVKKTCQKNTLVRANTRPTTQEMTLHMDITKNTKIRLIIFIAAKDGEALYSQQTQDQELTVAQIMNSLLPNLDLN